MSSLQAQWPGHDVNDEPLVTCLHEGRVPRLLHGIGRVVLGGEQRMEGRGLIGAPDVLAARDRGGMRVTRATGRGEQIVVTVLLHESRALADPQIGAREEVSALSLERERGQVDLLHDKPGESLVAFRPIVMKHVEEVVVVAVVEQCRIEAAGIDEDRLAPGPLHILGRDDVVERIQSLSPRLDIGEDQPEPAFRKGQVGGPDASRILIAPKIDVDAVLEWGGDKIPVDEISRVIDVNTRKPFEG